MAISAEINKLLADKMFAIYSQAETLMLEKVAKRVNKGITQKGWNERKLQEVTKVRKEIEKIMNNVEELAKYEVSQSIIDAYQKGIKSAEIDFNLPKAITSDIVPASVQRLVMEASNMITKTSHIIARNVPDIFATIQAEVSVGVLTGVETRRQIAQRMLNRLADNGITSFVDKAGRKWEMASYAEMATRTVTARAAIQGHIDRQIEAGRDLVIVSDHSGSCPVCRPWEGKVLSITGNTPGYISLSTAQSRGLFHPNCRHTITGYIEGLTNPEPPKSDSKIYEYEQKQRYNERQIRRWKRRKVAAITPQEQQKATKAIRIYQAKQRQLLKDFENEFGMTLRRKYDRESITNRMGKLGKEGNLMWTAISPTKIKVPKSKTPKITGIEDIKIDDYKTISDNQVLQAKLVNESTKYIDSLNDLEQDAINIYTGSEYSSINTVLRKNILKEARPKIQSIIKQLDKVFKNNPKLSENIKVFRRIDAFSLEDIFNYTIYKLTNNIIDGKKELLSELKKKIINTKMVDKGYMSTTYKRGAFGSSKDVEFEIYLKKGNKRGIFVENYSQYDNEKEFLLNRGTTLRIFDVIIKKRNEKENIVIIRAIVEE